MPFIWKNKIAHLCKTVTTHLLRPIENLHIEILRKSFEINKTIIDRNRREYSFKLRDMLYIVNGNKLNRKKLDTVRVGPFKVIQRHFHKNHIIMWSFEIAFGKKKSKTEEI